MINIYYLISGSIAGLIFYWGLQKTIQHFLQSPYAPLVFPLSFFIRISVILICLYYFWNRQLETIFCALLGFIISQILMSKYENAKS